MASHSVTDEFPRLDAVPRVTIRPDQPVAKDELAKLLSVSHRTIERWVGRRELPPPYKLGRKPFWTGKTLLDFFAKRQAHALGPRQWSTR